MLLFLLACAADPPSISSISPKSGPAGTAVTIAGTGFSGDMTLQLGILSLGELAVLDQTTATGTVPEGLPPGPANLIVSGASGRGMTLSKAFTVSEPEPAAPCASDIKRMTHIPADGSAVKIDRHLPDGSVDRIQLDVREVKAVEYEESAIDGGGVCRTVYLRTRTDQRHLFDASASDDLRWQAQRIAGGLGKPLEVGETLTPETPPPAE
ncbi:MAG: IPT/TIG domain-containing protein [Myxococcota bacterium]|nr:IPT/TIG domain-containing protein [Myxococcota bacterium]